MLYVRGISPANGSGARRANSVVTSRRRASHAGSGRTRQRHLRTIPLPGLAIAIAIGMSHRRGGTLGAVAIRRARYGAVILAHRAITVLLARREGADRGCTARGNTSA